MGKIVKLTPTQRALAEAHGFADRGDFDQIPSSDAALAGMGRELKILRRKVQTLYAVTAIGAFLILAQAPNNSVIGIFGISISLSALSKQALAVLLAGCFGYYAAAVQSTVMLYATMAAIVRRAAPESWDFLLIRYDADLLWMNLLLPKKLGAPSPKSERAVAITVQISNLCVVAGHTVLVAGAVLEAMVAAISSHSWFGAILGIIASIGTLGAVIGLIASNFIKLSYVVPAKQTA